jgi:hypothetical protein
MTAFFHLGPVLVTEDVQQYWDPSRTLSRSYKLNPPSQDDTLPGSALRLPSLDIASWAWLQPFVVPGEQSPGSAEPEASSSRPSSRDGEESAEKEEASPPSPSPPRPTEAEDQTRYMALGLAKVDARPGFERGPYTALEGYLQLKAPIIRPDAPVPPSPGS